MAIDSSGRGGSVVCLHGLGRPASDWDAVRAGLEAFGPVCVPPLPRSPADAFARVDAIVEPGSIVIGHSMGGILALRVADRPLRAVVVTGCFFPPARNGRGVAATARDYASHRLAYLRALRKGRGETGSRGGTARALGSLALLAARPGGFASVVDAVSSPVLIVHARDDHHVPVDFALAVAARRPAWTLGILDQGGHHAHVARPEAWLDIVAPWLAARE